MLFVAHRAMSIALKITIELLLEIGGLGGSHMCESTTLDGRFCFTTATCNDINAQ
jgi:hypothetical protein